MNQEFAENIKNHIREYLPVDYQDAKIMHKVKHCHADTFHFHDSAEGACQLPFGVQKKIRAN